jgi:hypothetical protein
MVKPWRELEKLVADLERLFADSHVEVKSPDRLRDRHTGRLRDVDVSVRGRVGSSDLLVIIECRSRSKKSEIDWIEQVATKMQDVGAHRALAVSAKPFTAGAIKKAAGWGIELRTFSEVDDTEILRLLGGVTYSTTVEYIFVYGKLKHSSGQTPTESSSDQTPTRRRWFEEPRDDSRAFVRTLDGVELSIFDLLPVKDDYRRSADRLPFDQPSSFTQILQTRPGDYAFKSQDGLVEIDFIQISVRIERRPGTVEGTGYRFERPDGSIAARGTQMTVDTYGIPLHVNYLHPSAPSEPWRILVRRDDHDRNRILFFDFELIGPQRTEINISGILTAAPTPPELG